MRYTLENDLLKIEIDSKGAEIKSAHDKKTGHEYMWQADPTFWARTSPILFPIVGSLNNETYRFDSKEYNMKSHGFARDTEFALVSQSDKDIWFEINDTDVTYEIYPFHFKLKVGYELEGKTLKVKWNVYNPGQDRDDENLYFSIGAHPAFNCPIHGEENKEGYRLYFGEGKTELHHHGNLTGTCTHEDIILKLDNERAYITKDFFDRSTYIIENKQLDTIAIEEPDGKRIVTVNFDTPLVAVWSPVKGKNAPFICIEPWWGRADYNDYEGTLEEREYGNVLSKGEEFNNTYSITYGA